jgi:hypothetical protein
MRSLISHRFKIRVTSAGIGIGMLKTRIHGAPGKRFRILGNACIYVRVRFSSVVCVATLFQLWSDSKVRELIAVELLHASLLNITVVTFKVRTPLGSYAPMPAPSPSFKPILKLVLWNDLQSCVVLLLISSMSPQCLPFITSFIFGKGKEAIGC